MGICASCLGLGRRNSYDPENSHLLYRDDPYQNSYGTLHNAPNGALQQDPQNAKREREALDQITQRTSDAVIDIFALQPPNPAIHATASDKSSKSTHSYHGLIKNVYSVEDLKRNRPPRQNGDVCSVKEDSISRDFGTVRRSRQGDLVTNVRLE